MKRKKEAKNNNLSNYREEMMKRNKALVKRCIEHILRIGGPVTYSSVSKVTYDLADAKKGEKGLSVAAISKSKVYRVLVDAAGAGQESKKGSHKFQRVVSTLSKGDLQMSLHVLRVENAEQKMEISILKDKLDQAPNSIEYVKPMQDSVVKLSDELKSIARSLVNRLCELDLAYIDTRNYELILAVYNEVIMQKSALELFYMKEINEIKSKNS